MKICNKCNQSKSPVDFYKSKIRKDGLQCYCKSCCNLSSKKYYEANKVKIKDKYENNKSEIVAKNTAYKKKKKQIDPMFKSVCNLRSRLSKFCKLVGLGKRFSTMESIGIPVNEFKLYIESLFIEGMNWDNYGEWEIDHIKPICTAKTEEDLFLLNRYTNLQPLWKSDNLSKGGKHNE